MSSKYKEMLAREAEQRKEKRRKIKEEREREEKRLQDESTSTIKDFYFKV